MARANKKAIIKLARELQDIEPQVRPSPWAGYEHYRGYAMMVLPFASGHLLGLRVFPQNDFAPYKSVWHRTPAGDWSIYNDGPSLGQSHELILWGRGLKSGIISGRFLDDFGTDCRYNVCKL
jgi:hypothetical protein